VALTVFFVLGAWLLSRVPGGGGVVNAAGFER
jgi:hypothetical protein